MIREEMLDPMGANETALLIERYRQRAVARADLQYGISPLIRSRHKIEQGPPVSEPVTFRNDGDVLISRTPSPSSVTTHSAFTPLSSSTYMTPRSRYRPTMLSCSSASSSNGRKRFLSPVISLISIAVHHLTDTFDQQSIIRFANLSQDTTQWADYAFSGRVIMDGHSPRTQQSSHSADSMTAYAVNHQPTEA